MFSSGKYPKVLIAAPIYEHKYYCIQDYIDNCRQISYPNFDILLVDNSKDETAHKLVKEMNPDINIVYTGFFDTTRASQGMSYRYIRDEFLKGDYEYLMTIESDLFPHETIIEDLMANDKDICGAIYMLAGSGGNLSVPCVTTGTFNNDGNRFREDFMDYREIDGKLKRVHGGCGLGCTLIKRKVLEEVEFMWSKCHADTYFHRDSHRKGFETWIDTRFVIFHDPSEYPSYF